MLRKMVAVAAALMSIALVACAGDDIGSDDDAGAGSGSDMTMPRGESEGGQSSEPERSGALTGADASGDGDEAAAPGQEASLPQLEGRRIILTTSMTIDVTDVQLTFGRVQSAATQQGGFVQESDLRIRENDAGEDTSFAFITVRVPAERRDAFLSEMRGLDGATVRSEQTSAEEVTAEYTDLSSRLRNLERIEQQYLDLLTDASRIDDILTVTDRIDGVRLQIEQIEGRLALLDDLADLATVTIEMQHVDPEALLLVDAPKETSISSVFADSWEVASNVGMRALFAGVVLVVAAIWLVPVVLVAALMVWAVRRGPRAARLGARRAP